MKDFRKLKVWEKSHELTLAIYKATSSFPKSELFGMTRQIRRSCASIPANIAEGCGRKGEAELSRFFQIAMGSACELEYHLLLTYDLELLSRSDFQNLNGKLLEIKRMITSFIKKLNAES